MIRERQRDCTPSSAPCPHKLSESQNRYRGQDSSGIVKVEKGLLFTNSKCFLGRDLFNECSFFFFFYLLFFPEYLVDLKNGSGATGEKDEAGVERAWKVQ